ncbi:hypothetical protein DIPPA_03443 [Diplonema papillatum]|nr:hypothetical protein DIPPA_03443 [Diplonema papillatum]
MQMQNPLTRSGERVTVVELVRPEGGVLGFHFKENVVVSVQPQSAAEEGGLAEGMVIVAVNDAAVADAVSLRSALAEGSRFVVKVQKSHQSDRDNESNHSGTSESVPSAGAHERKQSCSSLLVDADYPFRTYVITRKIPVPPSLIAVPLVAAALGALLALLRTFEWPLHMQSSALPVSAHVLRAVSFLGFLLLASAFKHTSAAFHSLAVSNTSGGRILHPVSEEASLIRRVSCLGICYFLSSFLFALASYLDASVCDPTEGFSSLTSASLPYLQGNAYATTCPPPFLHAAALGIAAVCSVAGLVGGSFCFAWIGLSKLWIAVDRQFKNADSVAQSDGGAEVETCLDADGNNGNKNERVFNTESPTVSNTCVTPFEVVAVPERESSTVSAFLGTQSHVDMVKEATVSCIGGSSVALLLRTAALVTRASAAKRMQRAAAPPPSTTFTPVQAMDPQKRTTSELLSLWKKQVHSVIRYNRLLRAVKRKQPTSADQSETISRSEIISFPANHNSTPVNRSSDNRTVESANTAEARIHTSDESGPLAVRAAMERAPPTDAEGGSLSVAKLIDDFDQALSRNKLKRSDVASLPDKEVLLFCTDLGFSRVSGLRILKHVRDTAGSSTALVAGSLPDEPLTEAFGGNQLVGMQKLVESDYNVLSRRGVESVDDALQFMEARRKLLAYNSAVAATMQPLQQAKRQKPRGNNNAASSFYAAAS